MKDDDFKNAVNNLPEFEAPDVWGNIEKNIKPKKRRIIIPIIFLVIVGIGIIYIWNNNSKALLRGTESVQNEKKINEDYSQSSNVVNDDQENLIAYTEAGDSQITNLTKMEFLDIDFIPAKSIVDKNIVSSENNLEAYELEYRSDEIKANLRIETLVTWEEIGNNLVRNPSFEDFKICPSGIVGRPSRKLIPDWQVPNKGTPDYFNTCSNKEAGIPNNFAGRADSHSGNAYAGMILRQNFTRDNKITGEKPVIYREYIQNELEAELEAGRTYKIKFWVCNSTNSRFAVDGVGACLTVDNEWTNHKEVLELIPVVENAYGNVLMNQNYWVAIEGYYIAQGGEKHLTIGNFKNNFSTSYLMQDNASAFNYSYYYIDDVSVVQVEEIVEIIQIKDTITNDLFSSENDQAYDF
jgi:hypothetical protein